MYLSLAIHWHKVSHQLLNKCWIFLKKRQIMQKHNKHWDKTHRALQEIIFDLLKKYSVEKITVQLVCDTANINRSTFYAHYLDVYDLIDTTQKNKREALFSEFVRQSHVSKITFFDQSSLIIFLNFIKENGWFYKIVLKLRDSFPIQEGFDRLFDLLLTPVKRYDPKMSSQKFLYYFIAFQAGFTMILRHWSDTNYSQSSPQIATIIFDSLPYLIRISLNKVYQKNENN